MQCCVANQIKVILQHLLYRKSILRIFRKFRWILCLQSHKIQPCSRFNENNLHRTYSESVSQQVNRWQYTTRGFAFIFYTNFVWILAFVVRSLRWCVVCHRLLSSSSFPSTSSLMEWRHEPVSSILSWFVFFFFFSLCVHRMSWTRVIRASPSLLYTVCVCASARVLLNVYSETPSSSWHCVCVFCSV